MIEILERLIQTPGVSGYEDRVRNVVRESLPEGVKTDVDALGNLVATIGSGKRSMMFAAHLDEIGFVISEVREDGALKVRPLGGIDPRTVFGRALRIVTEHGDVTGVFGVTPPHLMRDRAQEMASVPAVVDLLVDVGCTSREEAEAIGVRPLDFAVLHKTIRRVGKKLISARALDDRAGCAVLLNAIQELHDANLEWTVHFAFTVQEEVGLRGAEALARNHKLDLAVAVDSASAGDNPFCRSDQGSARLGEGPCLRVLDNRAIVPRAMIGRFTELADGAGLPCQVIFTGGGTDMAPFQQTGCPSMAIGIPMRYTHSAVEMVHLDDLEHTVRFVCEIARRYGVE